MTVGSELGRREDLFELVEHRRGSSRRGGRWRPAPARRRRAAAARRCAASARRRTPYTTGLRPSRDLRRRSRRSATAGTWCSRDDLLGQLERGQRLEQREQRAAEQARLLAGDHGDGRADRRAAAPRRRARAGAPRRSCCAAMHRGDLAALPGVTPAWRAIASAHAARSAGSPAKNGATARKSKA